MSDRLLERITFDKDVCGGRPCIRGMRFRVQDVLEYLAGGDTETSLLEAFPYLEREDIRASLAYAARLTDHPVIDTRLAAAE